MEHNNDGFMDTTWYTTKEISALLKIDVRCAQRYIKSGQLKASWIGGGYRISGRDLRGFIESKRNVRPKRGPKGKDSRRRKND